MSTYCGTDDEYPQEMVFRHRVEKMRFFMGLGILILISSMVLISSIALRRLTLVTTDYRMNAAIELLRSPLIQEIKTEYSDPTVSVPTDENKRNKALILAEAEMRVLDNLLLTGKRTGGLNSHWQNYIKDRYWVCQPLQLFCGHRRYQKWFSEEIFSHFDDVSLNTDNPLEAKVSVVVQVTEDNAARVIYCLSNSVAEEEQRKLKAVKMSLKAQSDFKNAPDQQLLRWTWQSDKDGPQVVVVSQQPINPSDASKAVSMAKKLVTETSQ